MEEERVKQEIAIKLVEQGFFQKPDYVAITHQEMARYILAIKGIRLEGDKQDLPSIPYTKHTIRYAKETFEFAQQDMLKAGFVKVLQKE